MHSRIRSGPGWVGVFSLALALLAAPALVLGTTLPQISKDHAVYIAAQDGDILTITTDHRMGTDPDYIYLFGPDGKLQERLVITTSTTTQVALDSGSGTYKVLPVNYTYIHDYSLSGSRPMVVEPFDHEEFLRVTGSTDLYFQVPADTPSMTFYAHTMWSHQSATVELYDPSGSLVHTFVLPQQTFQDDHVVTDPIPGIWRSRFVVPSYSACGAWLEGVPNYFAASPADWFEPMFYDTPATATLAADATTVVSSGARVGVNWWLDPYNTTPYAAERDAVTEARMDTARLGVAWAYREPANDNSNPFEINWSGFNFSRVDAVNAAYFNDVVSAVPNAMPVLMMYWDNVGGNAVSWQLANPANWTQIQREEYAEFVLATMIHVVAPDLQDPPSSSPAYPFEYVELLNEPDLAMGPGNYQAYIQIVSTVGKRLKSHTDARIRSLKIIAPGITPGWSTADEVMENWIGKLIDQADAHVDGVNWHQYGYLRIEEHDRFAEDIAKVRGWLATRGDGIADEEILMTELNQHGGGPTWWKRQDTFYASRWWAGACLSALRGGVDLIHFYKLVDDPSGSYKYKGMLFSDGPYYPPVFPGGAPHGRKPIHEAAGFINEHRRDQVVSSTSDHAEIAQVVTLSQDHTGATVLLANLFDRTIDLDLQITLPPDMRTESYCMQLSWLDDNGRGLLPPTPVTPSPAGELTSVRRLGPQTLYAIDFSRAESGDPSDLDGDCVDNDMDCAPTNPGDPALAPEIEELRVARGVAGVAEISWAVPSVGMTDVAEARYLLISGLVSQLRADDNFSRGCGIAGTFAPTYQDTRANPAESDAWYYLVAGENDCGEGSWGSSSTGVPDARSGLVWWALPACP